MLSCPRCGSAIWRVEKSLSMHLIDIAWVQVYCSMHKEAHWKSLCSHDLMLSGSCPSTYQQQFTKFNSLMVDWHYCFHPPQRHSTQPQIQHHVRTILDKNCQKVFLNIFIISIHGLVYFHLNTRYFFVEFTGIKDAISLKQHQRFYLECIVLIIVNSLTAKSVPAGTKLVLFGRYVLNIYIGIVRYILRKTKTRRTKIYLLTQRTNRQKLYDINLRKKDTILNLYSGHRWRKLCKNREKQLASWSHCAFNALSNSANG